MFCPEAEEHVRKLEHSLDNILTENQKLQAYINRYEPVLDWLNYLVGIWEPYLDRMPDNLQELARIYKRAKEVSHDPQSPPDCGDKEGTAEET